MKRTKHSLSNYKLLTCDMGKLVPIGLFETLPGDTFQHSTSLLLRLSPLLAPVMHPISVRVHHFFVPNRLIYTGWEDFITGGPLGTGSAVPYPTNAAPVTPVKGDILDYLGLPTTNPIPIGGMSLLPVRGYNKIFNDYYRDEDLVTAVADTNVVTQNIAWEKDYFTTARPWTQKGPSVTLPLGGSATVFTNSTELVSGAQAALQMRTTAGNNPAAQSAMSVDAARLVGQASGTGVTPTANLYPTNLYADLSFASATNINAVRRAFALQRYQEARAQYGSRYVEYLRYCGVRSSDARLDRPEYLGGGKQTVSFSEVLRTGNVSADNATLPIGQLKGHGIAALRSNRYRYFCEEHGYIFTLLSVRPRSMYVQGIPKTWSKRTKEEYYQKELELIGQQEIYNRELFQANTGADANVFGYQDRYAEYRSQYSSIAGDFRNTLDYWHLARNLAATPTLNQSFTDCSPGKRIFAEQSAHSLWIMASHSVQVRRQVGRKGQSRVL